MLWPQAPVHKARPCVGTGAGAGRYIQRRDVERGAHVQVPGSSSVGPLGQISSERGRWMGSSVAVEMREVATELTMTVAQGMLHMLIEP